MHTIYKQKITISNMDYDFVIIHVQDDQYRLMLNNIDNTWFVDVIDKDKLLDRLKSALRNEYSMNYEIRIDGNNNSIVMELTHQMYIMNDMFIFKLSDDKTHKDVGLSNLNIKINEIEKSSSLYKCYPVYKDSIGPCVKYDTSNMTIDHIRTKLEYFIGKEISKLVDKDKDDSDFIKYYLQKYYDIRRVVDKFTPIPSKNEFIMKGNVDIDKYQVYPLKNVYTIFTKKFQNPDVVGYVSVGKSGDSNTTKIDLHVTFHDMKLSNGCPDVKIVDSTYEKCTEEDYYKYFYLFKLPIKVIDGIYTSRYCDVTRYITDHYLVKDNKVYMYNDYRAKMGEDMFHLKHCETNDPSKHLLGDFFEHKMYCNQKVYTVTRFNVIQQ